MQPHHTVYVSSQCPNCARFLSTLRRIQSLSGTTRIVDIDTLDESHRNRVEYVPTFVDGQGRLYTGAKAFEYLKQFDHEIELDSAPIGGRSLAFGTLNDGDGLTYSGFYGDFTPPPK